MLSRVAGRFLTSPLAFLLAGLIDLVAFWLVWAKRRTMKGSLSGRDADR
jgi:hypothetical protein